MAYFDDLNPAAYEFMQRMSAENNGIARRVFDNLNAKESVSFYNDESTHC